MEWGAHQIRTRRLWTVNQSAVVTNERVNGITGMNPAHLNAGFIVGYFSIRVETKIQINLTAVRIYGSGSEIATGSGEFNPRFPAPGTTAEALCATTTNLTTGRGIVRVPGMHREDPDARFPWIAVPNWLMLEYSTSVAGTATLIFHVSACLIGPELSSLEGT